MAFVAENFARSRLAAGLTNSALDVTLVVESGDKDKFPVVTAPDTTRLVIYNDAGDFEVVKVTARTLGSANNTVVRGQEGTAVQTWNIGDAVLCGPTADVLAQAINDRAEHEADSNPHPIYLTQAEGDARYVLVGSSAVVLADGSVVISGDQSFGGNLVLTGAGKGVVFEGATADAFEVTLLGGEPTADRIITLPDRSGTLMVSDKDVSLSGIITPTALAADTDDYAPTGLADATVLRLSASARCSLTGLTGGAAGRLLVLHNVGSYGIELVSSWAFSAAANRFAFPTTMLEADESVLLQYDATASRWRMLSRPTGVRAVASWTFSGSAPTEITLTGMPAWARRFTVCLSGLSTSGITRFQVRGNGETTGYAGASGGVSSGSVLGASTSTAGFPLVSASAAAATWSGVGTLTLIDPATNTYAWQCILTRTDSASVYMSSGVKAFSAPLTSLELTAGGVDTFDAGQVVVVAEA